MLLMGAILCSIVLWTHSFNSTYIHPQSDFDLNQFAGEWYRVGMAYDHPIFIQFKDKMQINKGFLVQNEDGGANLTMWSMNWQKRKCITDFYVYEKTNKPGLFTYFSLRHEVEKDITVVETNYTDYGIVLKYKKMNKDYTQLALYGRSPYPNLGVVEKFKSYALSLGFSVESIIIPSSLDDCHIAQQSNTTETTD